MNLGAPGSRGELHLFFDCDDCLYQNEWRVAALLTAKISAYCAERFGLSAERCYALYKQYGTCLRGLLEEGLMPREESAIDDFLREVHDVPLAQHMARDDALRSLLARVRAGGQRGMHVFTASVREHAARCLALLGIEEFFPEPIIDCKAVGLLTKHSAGAFFRAMELAQAADPSLCVLLDDSVKNIEAAKA